MALHTTCLYGCKIKRLVVVFVLAVLLLLPTTEAAAKAAKLQARQNLNLNLLNIAALNSQAGVNGQGVRIAVIDTGADVAHPALSQSPNGANKITHWADFTGAGSFSQRARGEKGSQPAEGDVALSGQAQAVDGVLTVDGQTIILGSHISQSNEYRYGWLHLPGPLARVGGSPPQVLVLALDAETTGLYDRVLVAPVYDGQPLDLSSVEPIKPYTVSGDVLFVPLLPAVLPAPPAETLPGAAGFGLVLNELAAAGTYANLGFDANGHGTHVAGLAAGFAKGVYAGTAPAAELLVLKALGSGGEGTWSRIMAAVDYAVQAQADIITISISGMGTLAGDGAAEGRSLRRAAARCGCLVIVSAGNTGPGLGTASTPSDDIYTLTVGAYTGPDLVSFDYGLSVANEGVAHYSGVGPRPNGSLSPAVLAPGSAYGPVPTWRQADGYELMEGTSMAAPQAAGVAALLVEAARHSGLPPEPRLLRRALTLGARPLPAVSPLEQGYGLVDAFGAWQVMQKGAAQQVDLYLAQPGLGSLHEYEGFYLRQPGPEKLVWTLRNQSRTAGDWTVTSTASWVQPKADSLQLAAGSQRTLEVVYDQPDGYGLHTGWLHINDSQGRPVASALQTLVRPRPALGQPGQSTAFSERLQPGGRQRHFFRVAPGTRRWHMAISHLGGGPNAPRLYVHLYDGQGRLHQSGVLGPNSATAWQQRLFVPTPGTWELVLSAAAAAHGAPAANYELATRGARLQWASTGAGY